MRQPYIRIEVSHTNWPSPNPEDLHDEGIIATRRCARFCRRNGILRYVPHLWGTHHWIVSGNRFNRCYWAPVIVFEASLSYALHLASSEGLDVNDPSLAVKRDSSVEYNERSTSFQRPQD